MLQIAAIVEGHGEKTALPELIRRIGAEHGRYDLSVKTSRLPGGTVTDERLAEFVRTAANSVGENGVVLVLLDLDKGCPAEAGPKLRERLNRIYCACPLFSTLAYREYESWFLAAAESLSERGYLLDGTASPEDPDAFRSAKDWLTDHMAGSRRYRETTDQVAFSATFDMAAARARSKSFARFYRICEEMLKHAAKQPPDQSPPNPA